MTRGLIFLCGLTLACAQNDQPTIRSTTRLVEFTVVALDRQGNPVTDLKKEDLSLLDNGHPREIAFFRYEGGQAPAVTAPALPQNTFTNRVELTGGPARSITALVLDSVNTEPADQMFVKAQTLRFLRAIAPQSRVAIYQLGREFRVLHDYTDDMESLRACLERVKPEFQAQKLSEVERSAREAEEFLAQMVSRVPGHPNPAQQPTSEALGAAMAGDSNFNTAVRGNRVQATLAILEALGRHISGIPGRKSVIWISGGIAESSAAVPMASRAGQRVNPAAGQQFGAAVRHTAERLAQSGVVLYAVDARGLRPQDENFAARQYPPAISGLRYDEIERAESFGQDTRAAFDIMATVTGGRFFFNSNDLSVGVRKAAGDFLGTYSIGFYADEDSTGRWHTLKASAQRPELKLLHRAGYFPEPLEPVQPHWNEENLRLAMLNPLGSSMIRLNAQCESSAGVLTLTLRIESGDLSVNQAEDRHQGAVEVHIGEKAAEGQVRFVQENIHLNLAPKQWEIVREKGIPYRHQWKPGADTFSLRILVRDPSNGRYGTLDIPMSRIQEKRAAGQH